jgi:hypothetical protein
MNNSEQPKPTAEVTEHTTTKQPATAHQLQKTEEKIDERMSAFERSTIRLTRAAIGIAILTVACVAFQGYEMYTGGKDTSTLANQAVTQATQTTNLATNTDKMKTSAEKSAQASRDFADTANDINTGIGDAVKKLGAQAKAAKESLTLAQNAFIMEDRPYVLIGKVHPEEDSKGNQTLTTASPIMWRVEFINYGKSPAVNSGGVGMAFFGPDAKKLAYAYMENMPMNSDKFGSMPNAGPDSIVPPGGIPPPPEHPAYTTIVSDRLPTKDELIYVFSHEFSLYVAGRYFYTDLQGNRYSTDYCRFRLLSGATADCAKYNVIR